MLSDWYATNDRRRLRRALLGLLVDLDER